jgi:protein TonB
MAQQGFLEQKPRSPGSLTIVIALHGAAIAALMLAKMEYVRPPTVITGAYNVKPDEPPPPEKIEPVETKQQQVKSRIDTVTPVIRPLVFNDIVITEPKPTEPVTFDPRPIGPVTIDPPADPAPPPKADPVRKEAQIDPRSRLQPAYPPSEERAEVTGSVTVIVTIGTDGRVKDVEKVRAASEAFYRATEQQALRHWRFKPATLDGKPIESRKTMTVHFQLDG